MFKRSLLLMMAALTLLSGRAQLNSRNVAVLPARPQSITRPVCQAQEMKMRDPGQLSPARAKRSGDVKPYKKNTDVSDLAAAAGLILLLKFAGDNAGPLSLDVPRHMTFTALSMRMPDMIGTEELRDWADRVLRSCGEEERLPERIAIYCTDSSRDALLGNLFQMIETRGLFCYLKHIIL